jgi:hypothetical protein
MQRFLLLLAAIATVALAGIINVPFDYDTIQLAVNAADSYDTILVVGPGPYCGANITKPLSLLGVNHPLIDSSCGAGGTFDAGFFLGGSGGPLCPLPGPDYCAGSGSTIQGFTIQGPVHPITAIGCDHVSIIGNTVIGGRQSITLAASDGSIVMRNVVRDFTVFGITMDAPNCCVSAGKTDLAVCRPEDNLISHNWVTSTEHAWGIFIRAGDRNTIRSNDLNVAYVGAAIINDIQCNVLPHPPTGNTIKFNNGKDSGMATLLRMLPPADISVTDNHIYGNLGINAVTTSCDGTISSSVVINHYPGPLGWLGWLL